MNKYIIRDKAIIVDIDGTLTIDSMSIPFKPNSTLEELRETKNQFYKDIDNYYLFDKKSNNIKAPLRPLDSVINLVRTMEKSGVVPIFMTAREDYGDNRTNTLQMLNYYLDESNVPGYICDRLPEEQLLMRPLDDFRPNHIVKRDLYNQYIKDRFEVLFVLDDEINNVNMFKDEGLIVLQPHYIKYGV